MKTRISVQERLKDLRVERGLNLEELAQETGISKSALGSYENDNDEYKEINHGSLLKLADFYQVSVDYLLGLTNNRRYENTPIEELHLSDEVVELLKSERFNNRHKTWDVILHDIRKAHENDSESAPDTTPADELIREVQKAMQSPGDRVQQFTEIFCKAFRLKYKRLSQEERSLLKKLFKKSPLIKQSGMNFRRRPWK